MSVVDIASYELSERLSEYEFRMRNVRNMHELQYLANEIKAFGEYAIMYTENLENLGI